jgi:V/A-type H+-transporting ATPase subunit K
VLKGEKKMNARTRFSIAMAVMAALLAALTTLLWWWPGASAAAITQATQLAPETAAWGFAAAAAATGLAAIGAGIAVASVGAAAVGAIAEKPELFGRMLILVGLAEGIAIYGLIVSILVLDRLR